MASGNYNLPGYEADENSPAMDRFLVAEDREAKLKTAFGIHQQFVTPGTKWVYQSSATFILTQAMNGILAAEAGTERRPFQHGSRQRHFHSEAPRLCGRFSDFCADFRSWASTRTGSYQAAAIAQS
jgi:hypothetical protein